MTKPKLSVKEAKLLKATLEGKNQTEAGLEADPNRQPETARVWANETLQKPTVQQAMQDAMVKAGITPELVIQPVADALNHEDLDMRLKGHDRAVKVIMPKAEPNNTFNNFGTIVAEMRDKYAD